MCGGERVSWAGLGMQYLGGQVAYGFTTALRFRILVLARDRSYYHVKESHRPEQVKLEERMDCPSDSLSIYLSNGTAYFADKR